MTSINRRDFLKASLAGTAGLMLPQIPVETAVMTNENRWLGPVSLGKQGIEISRIAMGTGVNGWQYSSNVKRLGIRQFVSFLQHNFEKGITFIDTADIYGTHEYVREALKIVPREKVQIMTKVWTLPNNWATIHKPEDVIDQFRKELNTDYIDIVLIHSQTSPNWLDETAAYRDALSEAQTRGFIGTVGVSCHSWEAMLAASRSDWVEVLLSRINDNGSRLDNDPETVMGLLKKVHDSGKGVIGMKVFGGGAATSDAQRESSLRFVWNSGNVDAVTLGMVNTEQVNDALLRIQRILAESETSG